MKMPSQQFLQQQLCWGLFAVPLADQLMEGVGKDF